MPSRSSRSSFVTGASGMLGTWLTRALLERGDRVTVLRRRTSDDENLLALEGLEEHCAVVVGDVADEALIARAVAEHRIDTVFHLAAQSIVGTALREPAATFDSNVRGTWSVLEAARRGGVARVVVAASERAYGEPATPPYAEDLGLAPQSPYDASKAAADLIARSYWPAYGVPVATTRCANLYGGGDLRASRLIPELVAAALNGRPAHLRSDGTPERDFLYVGDAVDAYLAIADALDAGPARGEAFNAGGGRLVSVRELVETLGRVAGEPLEAIYTPPSTQEPVSRQHVDIRKIAAVCGWTPTTSLEEGLRRTLEWYRTRPSAHRAAVALRSPDA